MQARIGRLFLLPVLIGGFGLMAANRVMAQNLRTLYTFTPALYPSYANSNGAFPRAGLVLSSNVLYGTAYGGGNSGNGVVFKISTDGTGYAIVYNFTATSGSSPPHNSDGANPSAGLILSANTLYGTTIGGG